MIRTVEVIVAVGILAAGLAGVTLYLSTQPASVEPQNLAPQAYTTLEALVANGNLTCSMSQERTVEGALNVLLPPTATYNFTLYVLAGGQAAKLYSVANSGPSKPLYAVSVEVVVDAPARPAPPGAPRDLGPVCFAVLTLGEG